MAFFGRRKIQFKISPNGLLSNHFMILGATNSGKSTSALSILEQLNNQKIKFILIDPTGEYDSAFKDDNEVEPLILGKDTKMKTGKINDDQWLMLFNPNSETQEQELLAAIYELKIAKKLSSTKKYSENIIENGLIKKEGNSVKTVEKILNTDLSDNVDIDVTKITDQLINDEVKESDSKYDPIYKIDDFKRTIFKWLIDQINYRLNKLQISEFLNGNEKSTKSKDLLDELSKVSQDQIRSLYINTSKIGMTNDSGKMIIDLLCNELLSKRIEQKFEDPKCVFKPIILFIDEVHRYALEKDVNGNYSTGLINIAREGRKYGIFLFLTSQSPKDVPSIILNQIGTLLVHNLTGKDDLKVISNYFDDSTLNSLGNLGQGDAILTGVNLIKNIQLRIKPSALTQNNETPYIREYRK